MESYSNIKIRSRKFLSTKTLFIISIFVFLLTILSIWLLGLGQHRTLFINSLLSTTILSAGFFFFLALGLYDGIKLKDDVGKITDKINLDSGPDLSGMDIGGLPDLGDEIGGILIGILLWILVAILVIAAIWALAPFLWAMILIFMAMLYWIFFRALRLVFKHAPKCKGNVWKSITYGLLYTTLYNFWVYGIILGSHYIIH